MSASCCNVGRLWPPVLTRTAGISPSPRSTAVCADSSWSSCLRCSSFNALNKASPASGATSVSVGKTSLRSSELLPRCRFQVALHHAQHPILQLGSHIVDGLCFMLVGCPLRLHDLPRLRLPAALPRALRHAVAGSQVSGHEFPLFRLGAATTTLLLSALSPPAPHLLDTLCVCGKSGPRVRESRSSTSTCTHPYFPQCDDSVSPPLLGFGPPQGPASLRLPSAPPGALLHTAAGYLDS